jgi:hypothetical protein
MDVSAHHKKQIFNMTNYMKDKSKHLAFIKQLVKLITAHMRFQDLPEDSFPVSDLKTKLPLGIST